MNAYKEQLRKEKETLDFVITDLVRQITEEEMPQIPLLSDHAEETANQYRPIEYFIDKIMFSRVIGSGNNYDADVIAQVSTRKLQNIFDSFSDYWDTKKRQINNSELHTGQRALAIADVFTNLTKYFGNDLKNKYIKTLAKPLHEMLQRILNFSKTHDETNMTMTDAIEEGQEKQVIIKNLYERIFNKENIQKLIETERNGELDNKSLPLTARSVDFKYF